MLIELSAIQRIKTATSKLRDSAGWVSMIDFRVEAPVTRRSPHRSGREDFPHPVPQNTQALRPCITRQISLRLAHNSAAQLIISDAVSADEAMETSYS